MAPTTAVSPRNFLADLASNVELLSRLDRIEDKLNSLLSSAKTKEFYSTSEAAQQVRRTKPTIRRLCREGRIHAERATGGRGGTLEWRISHEELMRYLHEGSRLPLTESEI